MVCSCWHFFQNTEVSLIKLSTIIKKQSSDGNIHPFPNTPRVLPVFPVYLNFPLISPHYSRVRADSIGSTSVWNLAFSSTHRVGCCLFVSTSVFQLYPSQLDLSLGFVQSKGFLPWRKPSSVTTYQRLVWNHFLCAVLFLLIIKTQRVWDIKIPSLSQTPQTAE